MRTIRHISAGSVFKVVTVLYGLLFAVFGCLFLVLPALLGGSVLSSLIEDRTNSFAALGAGTGVVIVLYVVGVLVVAFLNGLVAAIGALLYNVIARWVGGIRVDLE